MLAAVKIARGSIFRISLHDAMQDGMLGARPVGDAEVSYDEPTRELDHYLGQSGGA